VRPKELNILFEQLVIGFDAREMWLGLDAWTPERKRSFLLRQDIEKPLSTDTMVWPSLFHSHRTVISGSEIITGSVLDLEFPIEYRTIDNLWIQLSTMQGYLDKLPTNENNSYWVIAIAELMSFEDKETLKPTHPVRPLEIDSSWKLLGFDVSQTNLSSGLTNERYDATEIETLRTRWSPHLNKYHLFSEEKRANEFAAWADRDIGHAPYHIYAIYLVDHT
jgi:hypothetical protein